jgi:hypothetical protein
MILAFGPRRLPPEPAWLLYQGAMPDPAETWMPDPLDPWQAPAVAAAFAEEALARWNEDSGWSPGPRRS